MADEPRPNQVLGGRTPLDNGQDQIVQSGTTVAHLLGWLLKLRLKHSHPKITMTHTQPCSNCITLRRGKKGVRPTEVGALAPVFEKSDTELKLKQKLSVET